MRVSLLNLILFAVLASGCMTSKVSPSFDVHSELAITIRVNRKVYAANEEDQSALREILRFWLPKMRTAVTTYPTPEHRLHVVGKDEDGKDYEGVIFVGANWIGDGRGVVTLADTQVFRLHRIIKKTIDSSAQPSASSQLESGR
jgi:hypothetical protein